MAATCFVQPLDLVKNRMQVIKVAEGAKKPTTASVIMNVVKQEGLFTLYNGLSAGLLRQATYTTTRLGIYTYLFETFSGTDGKPPGFFMKAALGEYLDNRVFSSWKRRIQWISLNWDNLSYRMTFLDLKA